MGSHGSGGWSQRSQLCPGLAGPADSTFSPRLHLCALRRRGSGPSSSSSEGTNLWDHLPQARVQTQPHGVGLLHGNTDTVHSRHVVPTECGEQSLKKDAGKGSPGQSPGEGGTDLGL